MSDFSGLAPCNHCGFCLQSCPTYVATGDEADSPRGRIVLIQRLAGGAMPADDAPLQHHLDRCLGCRACEPVCPSGVTYGGALEAARALIGRRRPLAPLARFTLTVLASPGLRRPVLRASRVMRPLAARLAGWGRARFALGMLAGTTPWREEQRERRREGQRERRIGEARNQEVAGVRPRGSQARRSAVVFLGCVQRELFEHVNAAAHRTLVVNGYSVHDVPEQGCCGALHAHAGDLEGAMALARANVRAFARRPKAYVAATAAGCGATLREYGRLLANDPLAREAEALASRVRDITELLATEGPVRGAPLPLRASYDAPCHLVHAQRVADAPLAVLAAIPDLTLVRHDESDACCGSAGLYAFLQRDLSHAILRRKLAALDAAAPDVVVTGNPGCAMQLAAGLRAGGLPIRVAHPIALLDASYARAGHYGSDGVDSPDP